MMWTWVFQYNFSFFFFWELNREECHSTRYLPTSIWPLYCKACRYVDIHILFNLFTNSIQKYWFGGLGVSKKVNWSGWLSFSFILPLSLWSISFYFPNFIHIFFVQTSGINTCWRCATCGCFWDEGSRRVSFAFGWWSRLFF